MRIYHSFGSWFVILKDWNNFFWGLSIWLHLRCDIVIFVDRHKWNSKSVLLFLSPFCFYWVANLHHKPSCITHLQLNSLQFISLLLFSRQSLDLSVAFLLSSTRLIVTDLNLRLVCADDIRTVIKRTCISFLSTPAMISLRHLLFYHLFQDSICLLLLRLVTV